MRVIYGNTSSWRTREFIVIFPFISKEVLLRLDHCVLEGEREKYCHMTMPSYIYREKIYSPKAMRLYGNEVTGPCLGLAVMSGTDPNASATLLS